MLSKPELRKIVADNLDSAMQRVNDALAGNGLDELEPVLKRIGRNGRLPHWYDRLKSDSSLPNMDGKTVGSVLEMIFLAVLETETLAETAIGQLRINPARGVDFPDLDLGVKSPSKNFCTSEPFFSAYERLYGCEYDAVVMLTDYQDAKKVSPPLQLQIEAWRYVYGSQLADANLCSIAAKHRTWLLEENEGWARRVFRFLAFVNQSDWLGKKIVDLLDSLNDEAGIAAVIEDARTDFNRQNAKREKKNRLPIPDSDLLALRKILQVRPMCLGVIDTADNWVVETTKELGRAPNDNEWNRLLNSPLDGRIGMSFALQWRYNFGRLFGVAESEGDGNGNGTCSTDD